jgi:hypothetical protein
MLGLRWGAALTAAATGAVCLVSTAWAADLMPVKASPPPPEETLDVHGFVDVTFGNDYITPRGLLVTNTGLTTQVLSGLALDLYKDKGGWLNDVNISAGVWNDLWSEQHDPSVGPWNEFDWFVGADFIVAKNWDFGVQYIDFVPPAHDLITSFPSVESNIQFSLSYDDSGWGSPIPLHPYAKLFYEISGPSTVVLGDKGNTYDVELGIVPTLDTKKFTGMPLVITAPTWVTVGPTTYWNSGAAPCGPSVCANSNFGVFTTGLEGKLALSAVPKRLGNWYVKAGAQYYYLINDALLGAQVFTGTAGGASGVFGTFADAHRDVGLFYTGFGVTF